MENLELVCFQLISLAGSAKSKCYESLKSIENGNREDYELKIEEAGKLFIQAHKIHAELIAKEAAGDSVDLNLLLVNAEDQLAAAEMSKDYISQMAKLYDVIGKLREEIKA